MSEPVQGNLPTIRGSFEAARRFMEQDPMGAQLLQLLEPKRYLAEGYWPYWANTLDTLPSYKQAIRWSLDVSPSPEYFGMLAHSEALKYELPTYFLTKELAQALLRTVPPIKLPISRLKLPFPFFRVVLQKGAYTLENGAEFSSFLFGLTSGNDFTLPPQILREFPSARQPPGAHIPNWIVHSAGVEPNEAGFKEIFYTFFNVPAHKVQTVQDLLPSELAKYPEYTHYSKHTVDSEPQPEEQPSLAKDPTVLDMSSLLINLVLFLQARPQFVSPERCIRKGKVKGSRKTDDLWSPRIVGQSFKIRTVAENPSPTTGGRMRLHWRAGHWKFQPHGPNMSLRKEMWIEPYQAGI